ncbi:MULTISPECIES: YihY/virulence factor BrkB family protein [Flavobacterium]|uniref:YihY/virulence factor BrkB family protein n=1 Tax=Flavobacterium gawalongense TaxID=2594432 RepID=A0A553BSV4_9FLAO|nr:YihY/virulence factor BrkB family protein [Flavobacterium gawalongense]TRX03650.1 YihY/virulence factor BrkB family protein [Flavobacterium gawalongense]TRX08797.1 YihY/virulence factor BrkB family protein [Flavobacterium gawalongense]TRX11324.1 YihY/virulence factor BrkB family protein [Flavobacterium gawalongense]TRX12215.1 YihY/virulence factor BrkB family protein [Flavobacterium gawalongense]TRX30246.1 YihY/virulence factor BrkB family protein [Flavobacterium gawalongense]
MSAEIEERIEKILVIRNLARGLKKIKLPWLQGLSLYDLLELYGLGIVESALTYHASAIAFSFFMALFPFALFILNLIPYIPIEGFQDDFLLFVKEGVPPNTYDAIYKIINDILNNSDSGLLSSGFILSIFLMANGLNGILGGFESSRHVLIKRGFIHQYIVALAMSLLLSVLLIVTVAIIVVFEVFIQKTILSDQVELIILGRYAFVILMILVTTSILFKFGTKHDKNRAFISIGSVFTTILVLLDSYAFGIWVIRFSKYNELYGSIGTLLILMFYIWINCMILLLGFELNASVNKLKAKKEA